MCCTGKQLVFPLWSYCGHTLKSQMASYDPIEWGGRNETIAIEDFIKESIDVFMEMGMSRSDARKVTPEEMEVLWKCWWVIEYLKKEGTPEAKLPKTWKDIVERKDAARITSLAKKEWRNEVDVRVQQPWKTQWIINHLKKKGIPKAKLPRTWEHIVKRKDAATMKTLAKRAWKKKVDRDMKLAGCY